MFNKTKIEELYPQAGELMWEPMLMWKLPKGKENTLEEVCDSGKYFASLKKDGACYQVVKTKNYCYLFGRTISKTTGLLTEKIDNVPHIKDAFSALPSNTVIVVEIYYPGKTSKDVTTIMGCLPKLAIERQKDNLIHAYAHDILMYDGIDLRNTGALERYKILQAIWKLHGFSSFDFLELAQPIYENIFEAGSNALKDGEEGLVLRKKDSPWICGKRPAWSTLKLKQTDSVDLVCMGFCKPTKEYQGDEIETWPFWACERTGGRVIYSNEGIPIDHVEIEETITWDKSHYEEEGWIPVTKFYAYGWPSAIRIGAFNSDGVLTELGTVSSGLTDEDKQGMAERPNDYLNKVVSLDCMQIDKKEKTLRHPVFKSWRRDKDAKDCLISEIFA